MGNFPLRKDSYGGPTKIQHEKTVKPCADLADGAVTCSFEAWFFRFLKDGFYRERSIVNRQQHHFDT